MPRQRKSTLALKVKEAGYMPAFCISGVKDLIEDTYRGPQALEFRAWLSEQVSTLDEAKAFILKWGHDDGQVIQGGPRKGVTASIKWMAAHLSLLLDDQEGQEIEFCFATTFGFELHSHWQDNFPKED